MDLAQLVRNLSQRCSISSLVTFACLLVMMVMNLRQDSRIGKIEEISQVNHFVSKKSLDDNTDDAPKTDVGSLSTQLGEQPVLLLQALCMKNRFISKKSLDDKPDNTPKPGPGSLYTRWGRTTCPPSSKLVYDGVAAGQLWSQSGGGSNFLCLPNDPIWANYTTKVEEAGYIYGTEYELWLYKTNQLFSFDNAESIINHNVPCAVCLTRQPSVVMMLPARTKCYPGWTTQYSGYLMAGRTSHKGRSEYVCVDHAPEADPASYRDEGGATLFFVQAMCGSLPCPPYINGQELTCVVCSK